MLTKTRIEGLARQLGVRPPPLPLSGEGEETAAALLGELALTDTREQLARLLLGSQEHAWPERTGAPDKLTYEAVLRTAIAANALMVEVSRYTLAEQTGVSDSTARASLKRHVAKGRLVKFPREDEARATPYRINLSVLQVDPKPREHSSLLAMLRVTMQQSPPDLFCGRAGLSKAVYRYYEAVDRMQPQSTAELARKLGRNRSSAGRALRQLEAFGLVEKAEDGWLKTEADLEKLAEEHGTAGTTERKRAYHESLRPGHRAYLEHKAGSGNAEGPSAQDVSPRKGAMVSEAREARRDDRGTAIPRRSVESLSSDDGPRVPAERMETMGRNTPDLLADDGARQSVGGMAVGNRYAEEREAACQDCGNVVSLSASDLRPYSCAYCKGKFEFVDELAMAVA
jgi:ribosomal protein S25